MWVFRRNVVLQEVGNRTVALLVLFITVTVEMFVKKYIRINDQVGGATLLMTGMFLLFLTGFLETDVISLLNEISINTLRLGTMLMVLTYGLIVGGGFLLVVGIAGACCAKKKSNGCLILYTVILIMMILYQGAIAGLWITFRTRDQSWLEGKMLAQLKGYEGPQGTDTVSKGWNKMFMKARCCGVTSKDDFVGQDTIWANSKNPSENVPSTCCKGVEDSTIDELILSPCSTTPIDYYSQGCYNALKDTMGTYSLVNFICIGVLFLTQVLAIVFSCVVVEKKSKRVGPIKGPPPILGTDKVGKTKFAGRRK